MWCVCRVTTIPGLKGQKQRKHNEKARADIKRNMWSTLQTKLFKEEKAFVLRWVIFYSKSGNMYTLSKSSDSRQSCVVISVGNKTWAADDLNSMWEVLHSSVTVRVEKTLHYRVKGSLRRKNIFRLFHLFLKWSKPNLLHSWLPNVIKKHRIK